MIGDRYWTTGIRLTPPPDCDERQRWTLNLDFYDSGFCDEDSTEGALKARYMVEDMPRALDVLIADSKKLGIEFGVSDMPPNIYLPEPIDNLNPEHIAQAKAQAERLGWTFIYDTSEPEQGEE